WHRERDLRSGHGLVECERHLGLQVTSALLRARPACTGARARAAGSAAATAAAEKVRQDVAETSTEGARIEPTGHSESAERAGSTVVGLALLRIGQDVMRLGDLLEALLRLLVARVAVRVILTRKLAVRLLDLLLGGALG